MLRQHCVVLDNTRNHGSELRGVLLLRRKSTGRTRWVSFIDKNIDGRPFCSQALLASKCFSIDSTSSRSLRRRLWMDALNFFTSSTALYDDTTGRPPETMVGFASSVPSCCQVV